MDTVLVTWWQIKPAVHVIVYGFYTSKNLC
jgi:hypothetical protein